MQKPGCCQRPHSHLALNMHPGWSGHKCSALSTGVNGVLCVTKKHRDPITRTIFGGGLDYSVNTKAPRCVPDSNKRSIINCVTAQAKKYMTIWK